MAAANDNNIERKKLAGRNLRLAALLALLALAIYVGYILVYYFYR
jgi:uncharacterized membrane protein (DUF485 family)